MPFLQPAVEVPLSKALNSYSTDQWASGCCPLGKAQWWSFEKSSTVLSISPTYFFSTGSKYCGRCQLSKSRGGIQYQHRGQFAFQTRYKDVWGNCRLGSSSCHRHNTRFIQFSHKRQKVQPFEVDCCLNFTRGSTRGGYQKLFTRTPYSLSYLLCSLGKHWLNNRMI